MQDMNFDDWRKAVDAIIADRVGGLTSDDLPDVDYRGLYETGKSPEEAARFAVRNAEDLDPDEEDDEYWFDKE
jgi:hypothetical protein